MLFVNMHYAVSQETVQGLASQDDEVVQGQAIQLSNSEIDFHHSDNITNEIPFFDNRFRIDAHLDEITLIFFRERGSLPIILVQPDGEKIRVSDFDTDNVAWHDDSTFDMIKIIKPMPGPWQAIGDILPESKILIMSEVNIGIAPFPEVLLSGETLKVVGQLFSGESQIKAAEFRKVIQLDVNFFSTNNSAYTNFGADAIKVTSFSDNGRGLDEYAGDNKYTGEFVLNFAPGEWQPVFVIKMPLITRELRLNPILLRKSPIEMSVIPSENDTDEHRLQLTIDPTYVDPSSLVFQGKIIFPDKQSNTFSIVDNPNFDKHLTRIKAFPSTEPGLHRVNLSAFGKTITGREFRLVVPEFSFNIKQKIDKVLPVSINDNRTEAAIEEIKAVEKPVIALEETFVEEAVEQQKMNYQQENITTIIMIVVANILIIFIGFVLFMRNRKSKNKH